MLVADTTDARQIRQRIVECFEHAEQPNVPDEERRALLHFVIVGGGPTGVEVCQIVSLCSLCFPPSRVSCSVQFSAELWDFVHEDLNRLYPMLAPLVQITILEAGKTLLK